MFLVRFLAPLLIVATSISFGVAAFWVQRHYLALESSESETGGTKSKRASRRLIAMFLTALPALTAFSVNFNGEFSDPSAWATVLAFVLLVAGSFRAQVHSSPEQQTFRPTEKLVLTMGAVCFPMSVMTLLPEREPMEATLLLTALFIGNTALLLVRLLRAHGKSEEAPAEWQAAMVDAGLEPQRLRVVETAPLGVIGTDGGSIVMSTASWNEIAWDERPAVLAALLSRPEHRKRVLVRSQLSLSMITAIGGGLLILGTAPLAGLTFLMVGGTQAIAFRQGQQLVKKDKALVLGTRRPRVESSPTPETPVVPPKQQAEERFISPWTPETVTSPPTVESAAPAPASGEADRAPVKTAIPVPEVLAPADAAKRGLLASALAPVFVVGIWWAIASALLVTPPIAAEARVGLGQGIPITALAEASLALELYNSKVEEFGDAARSIDELRASWPSQDPLHTEIADLLLTAAEGCPPVPHYLNTEGSISMRELIGRRRPAHHLCLPEPSD